MNNRKSSLAVMGLASLALVYTDAAMAQIEEILVTARKRTEERLEVPVAISTFGKGFIETNAIETVEDVSMYTPGMVAGKGTGNIGGDVFMRGIGSGDQNALLEQSIALNINGAQVGGEFMFASMLDVEQVEVLKGPQALFFGKNSPGGVISIQSARPTEELVSSLRAGYETEAREEYAQFILSGPLSENLLGRLMVNYSTSDGWLDVKTAAVDSPPFSSTGFEHDRAPGRDELVIRATLEYEPTDRLNMTGWLTYIDAEDNVGTFGNMQIVACPLGQRQAFLPQYAAIEDCEGDGDIVLGNISDELLAAQPLFENDKSGFNHQEMALAILNLDYDISDHLALTSVSAFSNSNIKQVSNFSLQPTPFLASTTGLDSRRFTQELRILSSFDSPVNFMAGAFFETGDKQALVNPNVPLSGLFATEITDEDRDSYSAFAQLIWDVTDNVQISAGSRYTDEERDADLTSTLVPGVQGEADHDSDNLSSEINLRYMPTDELMVYIAYKEGFKSGGIDASFTAPTNFIATGGAIPVTYDEETISGFEGGLKAELLNRTLRLDLNVFHYEIEDLQLSFLDTETLSVVIDNAGKSTTAGAEFEFTWQPETVPGLALQGSMAYLDAEYDEFIADCYNGQSIAEGCNLRFDPAQGRFLKQDLAGAELTRAPELSGTLGVSYEWPFMNDGYVKVSGVAEYSDDYQTMLQNHPLGIQDSYVRTHASLEMYTGRSGWKFALIGRNLNDEWVWSRTSTDTLAPGLSGTPSGGDVDIFGLVQRGRQLHLEVTKEF